MFDRAWNILRPKAPLVFMILLATAAFLLLARYAMASDFRELAINRLQDDSYYYLQPAWNFFRLGFFTFDGIHPTYGFQPLWMILLSLAAVFSPDKVFFLRAAVGLGGFFFAATAIPLYILCRRWLGDGRGLIAPVLWLANPALAGLFITAKENALYAFLLTMTCVMAAEWMTDPRRKGWPVGVLAALTILTRVNAVLPVVLLLGLMVWRGGSLFSARLKRILPVFAGLLPILAVWGLYAWVSFGTVFPNSGSAKLLDSGAALVVFARQSIPWIPPGWWTSLLPESSRAFLARPDLLVLPTQSLLISYATDFLPGLALGSWTGLVSFLGSVDLRLRLAFQALLVFGVGAWAVLRLIGPRRELQPQAAAGVAVFLTLALAAVANTLINWLLMPGYLTWAVWYTVPEMLFWVLLAAAAIGLLIEAATRAVRWKWSGWVWAAIGVLLCIPALIRFAGIWAPKDGSEELEATQQQAYQAAEWMNQHLPPDARVGSYSAGLLGYFTVSVRVVNLDGLANSPTFVDRELYGHLLFVRGLSDTDPIRNYLRTEGIRYLANVDTVDRIQEGAYLGLVDPGGGVLLMEGDRDIVWSPDDPVRRFVVVEIPEAGS